jgi:hypothetical protein
MFPEIKVKKGSQVAVELCELVVDLCLSIFELLCGVVVGKPDPSGAVKFSALSVEKRNHVCKASPLIAYELMETGKLSG